MFPNIPPAPDGSNQDSTKAKAEAAKHFPPKPAFGPGSNDDTQPLFRMTQGHEVDVVDVEEPRQRQGQGHGGVWAMVLVLVAVIGAGLWYMQKGPAAAHADGWYHDVDQGIEAADAEGKPVLMLFTADWCPPCQMMKSDVFPDAEVQAAMEAFACIKIDLTEQGGPNGAIASEHGVRVIPTLIVFGMDGRELGRANTMDRDMMLMWLRQFDD